MNLRPEDLAPGALGPLDRLVAPGFRFVRFTLPWDEIEPARGAYLWDKWDEVAAAFAARPTCSRSSSSIARPSGRGGRRMRGIRLRLRRSAAIGAFARAEPSDGEVYTYFQPWDEPNIAPHWGAGRAAGLCGPAPRGGGQHPRRGRGSRIIAGRSRPDDRGWPGKP